MKNSTMKKEINIQGLNFFDYDISMRKIWRYWSILENKENPNIIYIFGDVSIYMQEVDANKEISWWKTITKVILI